MGGASRDWAVLVGGWSYIADLDLSHRWLVRTELQQVRRGEKDLEDLPLRQGTVVKGWEKRGRREEVWGLPPTLTRTLDLLFSRWQLQQPELRGELHTFDRNQCFALVKCIQVEYILITIERFDWSLMTIEQFDWSLITVEQFDWSLIKIEQFDWILCTSSCNWLCANYILWCYLLCPMFVRFHATVMIQLLHLFFSLICLTFILLVLYTCSSSEILRCSRRVILRCSRRVILRCSRRVILGNYVAEELYSEIM